MPVLVDSVPTMGKPSKTFDARRLLDLFDDDLDDETIGAALGVGRSTINKWRNGRSCDLSIYRADSLAIRTGRHPCLVWPETWWD